MFAVGLIVPHLIRDHLGSQAPFAAESIVLILDLGDSKREITLSGLPAQVCSKREMLIYFLMCLGTSVAQSVGRPGVRSCESAQWSKSLQMLSMRPREAGEEKDGTGWGTEGRKTRDRDCAKRATKEN